jgi:hypothetical protein
MGDDAPSIDQDPDLSGGQSRQFGEITSQLRREDLIRSQLASIQVGKPTKLAGLQPV